MGKREGPPSHACRCDGCITRVHAKVTGEHHLEAEAPRRSGHVSVRKTKNAARILSRKSITEPLVFPSGVFLDAERERAARGKVKGESEQISSR